MSADVSKHLERAQRCLEKNKVEDAIRAYLAVLEEAPTHQDATQALGDLYARLEQHDRAAVYYGLLFDLLMDPRDDTKALAIYNRFLRVASVRQPPERMARYAFLLQKQNRIDEAIEQFTAAAEAFLDAGRDEDALTCWERIAQIDPDNLSRHLRVAETAERIGKHQIAVRSFLRAGQIASASGAQDDMLKLLGRAYALAPQDRSVALLYAGAQLTAGSAVEAARLLEPLAASETDAVFFETYGEALMRAGELDRARAALDRSVSLQAAFTPGPFFELANHYARAGRDAQTIEILTAVKKRMFEGKRQNEFAVELDHIGEANPASLPIAEFWAAIYNELNRESRYYEALLHLFDLYFTGDNIPKACECIERLMEIDAYDYRNQQRLESLRGRVDDGYLKSIGGRLGKTAPSSMATPGPAQEGGTPEVQAAVEGARVQQALEDLIVQTEIFLQYSLQTKAIERLQKIAAMFPGEEDRNPRLRNLYETANWFPSSAAGRTEEPAAPVVAARPVPVPVPVTGKTGVYSAETLRDLTQISEINRKVYRQPSPRAMLKTAVNEVGTYLNTSRCLAVIGSRGRPHEMAAEYCAPGVKPAPGAQVVFLLSEMEKAQPDDLGGLVVDASEGSTLKDMGLATALSVVITDKETQVPAGMLIVAHAEPRRWKPNETYFLQAIGDQMLLSVSHTRLRSLVRRMGVSDERTGILSRSSYLDCLLNEADHARTQSAPLSLAILQVDRGPDLLRQQGEASVDRYLDQLARALHAVIRQSDLAVKYTAWSLAFVLPDTALPGARILADKLRKAAGNARPPWDTPAITLSVGIVEAAVRSNFENEDIVTDLINRAEASLDEARKQGGNTVVALETPKS
jgi:diguanylate cyclase (GGDEF)-like protein